MKVVIEPARKEDVPKILCIMKTVNMHNVPSPEMPELDWKCFFVAKVDGEIVGAAGYKILSQTEAKTTLMAVLPEHRRLGIGRLLQEKRMKTLCEKGIKTLTTNADIPETITWYKKYFGYKEVGKVKKVHEFGRPDIVEWTTLKADLSKEGTKQK
jgi:ribosomal-protein-alanine N-acetyltransferase